MSTIELDARKAEIARHVLTESDERIVNELFLWCRSSKDKKLSDKKQAVADFLKLASENRAIAGNYKFDRDSCYDR
jgi:hypothetical protein